MRLDDEIHRFTGQQHGLITTEQLATAGATRAAVRHRIVRGDLVRLSRRLLREAGAPVTDRQRALAGVLDAGEGAALSYQSGVALWELPGFQLLPAIVCRDREGPRCRSTLCELRELTRVRDEFITVLDGIPVFTPSFLLFQLAGELHPGRVARAMDTSLARRIASPRSLQRVLDVMARSGRNGTVVFRRLVAERPSGYKPPESGQESRLRSILDWAGERPLRRQINVGGDDWIGRMDFADDEVPFVLQVDPDRFHGALLDTEADKAQTKALEDAWFVVRRISEYELWHDTAKVLRVVREGRRLARQRVLARDSVA